MLNKKKYIQGISFVEVIVALAIFTIGIVSAITLIIDVQKSTLKQIHNQQALYLAQEGIEVAQSLYQSDPDISAGIYDLELSNGVWSLIGASNSIGIYTRVIIIGDVSQNEKKITSDVSWSISSSDKGSVILISHVYNWQGESGEAGSIDVSILDAQYFSNSEFQTIDLYNTSSTSITLAYLKGQWEGVAQLYQIKINGNTVFSTASTSGAVSGEIIDISDVILFPEATTTLTSFLFNGDMNNSDLLFTGIFIDNSSKYISLDL